MTTVISKTAEKKDLDLTKIETESHVSAPETPKKVPFSRKLRWLSRAVPEEKATQEV